MSPASYLTAPPRGVGSIIAERPPTQPRVGWMQQLPAKAMHFEREPPPLFPLTMRVAAIDLGHLDDAPPGSGDVVNGRVDLLVRRSTITRLGEGVDARRRLAISDRTCPKLPLGLPTRARSARCGASSARGDSAVRDAENGEAFLGEIEWSYGFTTRLLSGEDEADLTLRGVGELGPGRSSSTSAAGRRSSLVVEPARNHEPRLGSADRALPRLGPADGRELADVRDAIRAVLAGA